MTPPKPHGTLTVCITGGAGQISYSLLPLIASGEVFGHEQPIELRLLDIKPALEALNGVVMELHDCSFPLLRGIVATDDPMVAFRHADVAVLAGSFPRRPGMERRELLAKNVNIFKAHGHALDQVASKNVKIVVVGNPSNTNALVLSHFAPSIPKGNITALTRLDHNRTVSQVALRTGVSVNDVDGVAIWGNHSATQYPDMTRATAKGELAMPMLGGRKVVAEEIIPCIQKRGAAVLKARGFSSAMSAANAIGDHLRSWLMGDSKIVSMAVASDGSYHVKAGVYFSFPVRCVGGGEYEIVQGIELGEFSRKYVSATTEELFAEREEALSLL
ncbi:malate dehydrogenase [Gracilariopsis chorda]|uniref:Malate dehydrogenase n=2 Tax=Gracilariopsis TaxID=2781 RepID=A0A2V3IYC0_9FLOR|nr:malate dehydrogenase [Gracilariopsis lemaneiformis]PXF46130.1 malate dehydrogenase [Gracilariopsis chorda]|eukprot:PXF46130.1 malate dehydrogenase [Gracilariopsis chorda]